MSLLCLILFFIIQPSKNCHITNNGHFIFIAIRKSKKKKKNVNKYKDSIT